jgi:predicted anti-sigma-YlaC factor YlaD
MRCDQVHGMMARKASEGLSPRAEQTLVDHLRSCSECAALEDQLGRTWNALECHPSLEVSADFLPRLKAKLKTEQATPRAGRAWQPAWGWQWAAVAVCITLAVLILAKTGQFRHSTQRVDQGTNVAAERDRKDEQFLQDLEQTLQYSAADSLSTYDAWQASILEPTALESLKARPVAKTKKKEPS